MFQIDYITIVINKNINYRPEKHISRDPIIENLLIPALESYPSLRGWQERYFWQNDEMLILQNKIYYISNIKGTFFLKNNSLEKFNDFISKLFENNINFSISRIDFQKTFIADFQKIHKSFIKSKSKFKLINYSKNGKNESAKFSSTNLSVQIYQKSLQVYGSKKKSMRQYAKKFALKYPTIEGREYSRFEVCLKGKSKELKKINKLIVENKRLDLYYFELKKIKQVILPNNFLKIIGELK